MDSSMKVICMLMLLFASVVQASGCYESIISFGDSLADTGNLLHLLRSIGHHFVSSAAAFPYGETFFHRPTGRYSDGRLIIDFIGQMGSGIAQLAAVNGVDERGGDAIRSLKCSQNLEDFQYVDIVIEAIVESESVKKKLFVICEELCNIGF
nr:GDSL esterase/lipase At1g28590-like [Ipomoea batatas]